jgi:hypothetical protein
VNAQGAWRWSRRKPQLRACSASQTADCSPCARFARWPCRAFAPAAQMTRLRPRQRYSTSCADRTRRRRDRLKVWQRAGAAPPLTIADCYLKGIERVPHHRCTGQHRRLALSRLRGFPFASCAPLFRRININAHAPTILRRTIAPNKFQFDARLEHRVSRLVFEARLGQRFSSATIATRRAGAHPVRRGPNPKTSKNRRLTRTEGIKEESSLFQCGDRPRSR